MSKPGIPQSRSSKRDIVVAKDRDIIIEAVCSYFGVTLEFLQQRTRERPVAYKRQLLMYFLVSLTTLTYKEIGDLFGMDHSTVVHSKDRVKDWLSVDHEVQADIIAIKQKILSNLDSA
ncbi:MAG TPA: helix-turn-helix domain-containing protein [Flavisolibacter sp.]|nr:helix-turn-helix domain-containing protein [Flavisolibacter sp.]